MCIYILELSARYRARFVLAGTCIMGGVGGKVMKKVAPRDFFGDIEKPSIMRPKNRCLGRGGPWGTVALKHRQTLGWRAIARASF